MSRKKARQARTERMKAARAQTKVTALQQEAQDAINHLQHLLDEHGCVPTLSAICCARDLAVASHIVAHAHTAPNGEIASATNPTPGWEAERAGAHQLLHSLRDLAAPLHDTTYLNNPAIAFRAFANVTLDFAHAILDGESHRNVDHVNRNEEKQPGVSKPEAHPAKDIVDIQTLTPNATPEEREQAKKLVEDYGIGDTNLLQ
jgi:hypothetical protein